MQLLKLFHFHWSICLFISGTTSPLNCTQNSFMSWSLYFVPPIFYSSSPWMNEGKKKKANDCHKAEWRREKFAVGILSSFQIRQRMWKYFFGVKIIIMRVNIIPYDITKLIIAFFIEMISFASFFSFHPINASLSSVSLEFHCGIFWVVDINSKSSILLLPPIN